MTEKPKVIVIVGPTASGKSALAVSLAKKFNGEIISADSRQVYKGLDIGTGKVTKKEMRGIAHYMLDVANPKKKFTAADYAKLASQKVTLVQKRNKLPIIVGGTGFYIEALVDGIILPEVKPNSKLRATLEKRTAAELFRMLRKLDPRRAEEIDRHNKHRLVRAIEIAHALGSVPKASARPNYDPLFIGIAVPKELLLKNIHERLLKRLRQGMTAEVQKLYRQGLPWKRMQELGLEYRYVSLFLQKKMAREEMVEKLETKIWQYAKRQMTWFKRDKRIHWISPKETKKVETLIKKLLHK